MKRKFFIIAITILIFSLTGCGSSGRRDVNLFDSEEENTEIEEGGEESELTEETALTGTDYPNAMGGDLKPQKSSYYTYCNTVNNAVFYVRKKDVECCSYNPSLFKSKVSTNHYWDGYYYDEETDQIVDFEVKKNDYYDIANGEDYFICATPDYNYDFWGRTELTTSLYLVNSCEDFLIALDNIDLGNITYLECDDTSSFSKDIYLNGVICKAKVSYINEYGNDCKGGVVLAERKDGQYFYFFGGVDFSDDEINFLMNNFTVCDKEPTISRDISYKYEFSLGQMTVEGKFNYLFGLNDVTGEKIGGFYYHYASNIYYNLCSAVGIFYVPVDNTYPEEFVTKFSKVCTDDKLFNKAIVKDSQGNEWTRLDYNTSQINYFDSSSYYIYIKGNYVCVINVNYLSDSVIDPIPLMDGSLETVEITYNPDGALCNNSDYFLDLYGISRESLRGWVGNYYLEDVTRIFEKNYIAVYIPDMVLIRTEKELAEFLTAHPEYEEEYISYLHLVNPPASLTEGGEVAKPPKEESD